MNSFKSTITILFLLGVSYGVYRLIHTPDPTASGNGSFFVALNSATPNSTPGGLLKTPATNPGSTPSAGMERLAPKSIAPPPVPKIEAPDLALSGTMSASPDSKPPSMYQRNTNLPTDNPATTPAIAKLIPTIPPSSQSVTVAGSSQNPSPSGNSGENGPNAMTGPLTPVSAPTSGLPKANLIESAPPSPTPNREVTPSTSPVMQSLNPSAPTAESTTVIQDIKSVWPIVDAQVRKGEIAQSLQLLSGYYHANLAEADRVELLKWLDALAFKVIYSTEHRLSATPHVVRVGETLESIAKDWNIPQDLLVNINRSKIPANNVLLPGLELKIVRGPFRAEIDSQRKELTMFLDRYYAGRFAIDTSNCLNLKAGQLAVQNITADSPGQYRLELAGGICLVAGARPAGSSSIQLNVADAKDVFGILSANSQVTVIR